MYQQLAEAVADLQERFGGLPSPVEAQDIWGDIWYQEAHNSTAIEGNTLVLKEVQALLRDGRAVGAKQLSDYLEVRGYAEAARWIYGQALESGVWSTDRLLTVTEVRQVHALAMTPVWEVAPHPDATPKEGPGSFRRHEIQAFPGGMRPPSWTDIPFAVDDWVGSVVHIGEDNLPFPEALARRHAAFEQIHPFLDGNGRTGRLLLNLALIRLGYAPAIIHKRQRNRYLLALQRADSGDLGPLGEFLARSVLNTLHRFIVPAVAGPARLVSLVSLADAELSLEALRAAAVRGRLKAQRADRQWMSSRLWVEEYKRSRSARGQPRR
ncbi:MAG: Fic family protein [Chloroflexota bacterium]